LIKSRGHEVQRVDIPRPGKHPHSDLTGILLLAMSSFGLFVLVLSGILVINLLTAMMASQVRQIGVMKAIGGTRWQIAGIYFGQALFLGIAAVVVSVPLGITRQPRVVPLHGDVSQFRHQQFCSAVLGLPACGVDRNRSATDRRGLSCLAWYGDAGPSGAL
jgi:hypothetical protein